MVDGADDAHKLAAKHPSDHGHAGLEAAKEQAEHHDDTQKNTRHSLEEESNWPYGQAERKPSKEAWWRTLGRGRKRDTESE